jgi:hypothetical protein
VVIGALAATNQRFNGSFDEMRLFSRALSAAEIQNLLNIGNSNRLIETGNKSNEETKSIGEALLIEKNLLREENFEVSIHPNPVQKTLFIRGLWIEEGELGIQIWDMQGRLWLDGMHQVKHRSLNLDMQQSRIPDGAYIISIWDKTRIIQFKFIKE